jgi:hypothetical protein
VRRLGATVFASAAGLAARAQLLDQAIDVGRQRLQARQIGLVVGIGHERHLRHEARQLHVQAVVGGERLWIERHQGSAGQHALLVGAEQVK